MQYYELQINNNKEKSHVFTTEQQKNFSVHTHRIAGAYRTTLLPFDIEHLYRLITKYAAFLKRGSAFAQGCGGQGGEKIFRSRRFGFPGKKSFSPLPDSFTPLQRTAENKSGGAVGGD